MQAQDTHQTGYSGHRVGRIQSERPNAATLAIERIKGAIDKEERGDGGTGRSSGEAALTAETAETLRRWMKKTQQSAQRRQTTAACSGL